MSEPPDEFEWIARVLRPLAKNASEALDLADDAAEVPGRPGFDLVISQDAIVEGVHFLPDDPPDLVARKLLRVNLSDLAGKGAEPYGYFLAVAWPARFGWPEREAFARGLEEDQAHFGLKLFGGDTAATPGPLVASVTILGWVPAGRMVQRAGAMPGDVILVSGTIGDGLLGLRAARRRIGRSILLRSRLAGGSISPAGAAPSALAIPCAPWLTRPPTCRTAWSPTPATSARRAASALRWTSIACRCRRRPGPGCRRPTIPIAARVELATGGDDYEVVCTASPAHAAELIAAAEGVGLTMTEVGSVTSEPGVRVWVSGREVGVARRGYVHR